MSSNWTVEELESLREEADDTARRGAFARAKFLPKTQYLSQDALWDAVFELCDLCGAPRADRTVPDYSPETFVL